MGDGEWGYLYRSDWRGFGEKIPNKQRANWERGEKPDEISMRCGREETAALVNLGTVVIFLPENKYSVLRRRVLTKLHRTAPKETEHATPNPAPIPHLTPPQSPPRSLYESREDRDRDRLRSAWRALWPRGGTRKIRKTAGTASSASPSVGYTPVLGAVLKRGGAQATHYTALGLVPLSLCITNFSPHFPRRRLLLTTKQTRRRRAPARSSSC